MMGAELEQLLGRTMVLVAHPDDECITCGGLLQRMRDPVVVYATDGAPQDPYFWKDFGSREAYSRLRQEECRQALVQVGVREIVFLADREPRLVDQELFRNLPLAFKELMHEVRQRRPEAILTLAYEGGHPDHDSCSVLAHEVGKTAERPTSAKSGQMCGTRDAWGSQIPVWECPIYRRNRTGLSVQEFIEPNGTEVLYVPTAAELERKQVMCLSYPSQGDFLKVFGLECEIFRPQKQYDYSRRPHEGKLNYELWQWKMTGDEVAEKLAEFQRERARGFGERPASAN